MRRRRIQVSRQLLERPSDARSDYPARAAGSARAAPRPRRRIRIRIRVAAVYRVGQQLLKPDGLDEVPAWWPVTLSPSPSALKPELVVPALSRAALVPAALSSTCLQQDQRNHHVRCRRWPWAAPTGHRLDSNRCICASSSAS